MSRLRSRTLFGQRGEAISLAGLAKQFGGTPTLQQWCSDQIGNYPNANPLTIEHRNNVLYYVSGIRWGWWDTREYCNTALGTGFDYPTFVANSTPPTSTPPTDQQAFAEGLSKTNINTPAVDAPVFFNELRELPRMVMEAGRTLMSRPRHMTAFDLRRLPRQVATKNIEYWFGIAPFLSDLGKLLDFQAQVNKKIQAIDRLGSPNRQVRSATVWKDTSYATPGALSYVTNLYQEQRRAVHQGLTTRRKWVSTHWEPNVPLPTLDFEKRQLAVRLAYGLDISLSTLWEGMPWLWLIDWFSNVGDLVNLSRNTIPVKYGNSCLMTHLECTGRILQTIPSHPNDTIVLRLPPYHYRLSNRVVFGSAAPQVEFNLPFLDGRQASILGSLAVLKSKAR
jgi:hypothetical protein